MLFFKAMCIKYKNLWNEVKQQNNILENGLGGYNKIIKCYLPFLFGCFFFFVSWLVDLPLSNIIKNIISIMPSLIGFLVASMAIIISIQNKKIDTMPNKDVAFTYKQIGASMFFNATLLAFFLLIISFLAPATSPKILLQFPTIHYVLIMMIKLFVLFFFSKFIIMILYGLIYISSCISLKN